MRKYLPLTLIALGLAFVSCKDPNEPNKTTYYTINFNANGGSGAAPSAQKVKDGSSINLPNESGLSKTNYTFDGWNTKADGTGTDYSAGSSYTPTATITLYAKWNSKQYTITYNANGGSGTVPASQTVNAGSSITLPSGDGLSKTGYTFGGWNTNSSGTGTNYNVGALYTPTGTISLYAKWDAAGTTTYTVTYNINGGTGTTPTAQTVNAGDSVTLASGNIFLRSGYTFNGWSTNNSGTDPVYPAGFSYVPTNTIILYAKWDAAGTTTYTVTYNINGGTGTTPAAQTVNAGNSVTLASDDGFSRSGYTFGGWNVNLEGTGDNLTAGTTYVPTGTITLYAKWNAAGITAYTVTYNINDGTGTTPAAQTVNAGDSVTLASDDGFSKSGYTFGGWNESQYGTGENHTAGTSYVPIDTITLYAKWNEESQPHEHDSGTWHIALDATCAAPGTRELRCTSCNAVLNTQPIEALGHNWEWISTATETDDGTETEVCTHDNSHTGATRIAYATGTPGLAFDLINGNTAYSVNKGTVTSGVVHIPAYYRPNLNSDYLPVTEIGDSAFYYCTSLTGITIPANVTSINRGAFVYCADLTSVTFMAGSQLETIGDQAFYGCASLTDITIPASVMSIGEWAFEKCASLATVTFAAGSQLGFIGQGAFNICTVLASVTIPASVTSIGS